MKLDWLKEAQRLHAHKHTSACGWICIADILVLLERVAYEARASR